MALSNSALQLHPNAFPIGQRRNWTLRCTLALLRSTKRDPDICSAISPIRYRAFCITCLIFTSASNRTGLPTFASSSPSAALCSFDLDLYTQRCAFSACACQLSLRTSLLAKGRKPLLPFQITKLNSNLCMGILWSVPYDYAVFALCTSVAA